MNGQWWPKREDWPELGPESGRRYDWEQALALLMLEEIVIPLHAASGGKGPDGKPVSTIGLYVMCSDTFAYACADCEEIPPVTFTDEQDQAFWELYDLVRAHGYIGAVAWIRERRGGIDPICHWMDDLRAAGLA